MARMSGPPKTGIPVALRTHCPQGHEYTPENTRVRKDKQGTCRVCRTCERDRRRASIQAGKEADPLFHRRNWLRQTYGITLEQYEEMLEAQGGGCAVCGKQCSVKNYLSVDHNHETGEIRGLLCQMCNLALGYIEEDPARVDDLLAYLRRWSPSPVCV